MNTLLMVLAQALRQQRWLCLFGGVFIRKRGAAQALYGVSFLALVMTVLIRYRR